jgi:hypothetical protein
MKSGIYKHYKGGLYQVLGIAEHTETNEKVVVYVSLTGADLPGPRMRVRPVGGPEGFESPVKHDSSDAYIQRFKYLGDEVK